MNRSAYRQALAQRRWLLVQRSRQQRLQLAESAAPLMQGWVWIERVQLLVATLRRHPWPFVLPLAALILWRPQRVLRTLGAAIAGWRTARTLLTLARP